MDQPAVYQHFREMTGMNYTDVSNLDGVEMTLLRHYVSTTPEGHNKKVHDDFDAILSQKLLVFSAAVRNVKNYYQRVTDTPPEATGVDESMRPYVLAYVYRNAVVEGFWCDSVADRQQIVSSQWGVDIP